MAEDTTCNAPAKPDEIESEDDADLGEDHGGYIPNHMLLSDDVLSHLSLTDIMHARRVCRDWKRIINLALQAPVSRLHGNIRRRPCLMLLHPGSQKTGRCAGLSVFDLSCNAWLPEPIFFPGKTSFLVGASLGLFCFATENPYMNEGIDEFCMEDISGWRTLKCVMNEDIDYLVGNPLRGTWTCLPRPPRAKCICSVPLAMMAFVVYEIGSSPTELGYKLIKIESGPSNLYLYDSQTKQWDTYDLKYPYLKRNIRHIVIDSPKVLYCFDTIGSLSWSYNLVTHTLVTHRQAVYHMDPTKYKDYRFGLPVVLGCADSFFSVHRMQIREARRSFVVGKIPFILHQEGSIEIHRRRKDDERWHVVSTMPMELIVQAVTQGSDGTEFVIACDRICQIFFILKGSSRMLVFNVISCTWDTLPGCTYVPSFYPYKLHAFCELLV